MDMLPQWMKDDRPQLRPSLFTRLHGILLNRISAYPGTFRPSSISITHSGHQPPSSSEVLPFVEELCDYVNSNWDSKSALHLSAYILWRTNWIHPFADGNGRTARIISYLILCAHTKTELPGVPTIPEQISAAKQPYYAALEDADHHYKRDVIDVSALEALLETCLANQLLGFFKAAGGRIEEVDQDTRAEIESALRAVSVGGADRSARPILPSLKESDPGVADRIERRSGFYQIILAVIGLIVTLVLTVVGWIYFR